MSGNRKSKRNSTYHQRRQMTVTEELLDIVSEALGGGGANLG